MNRPCPNCGAEMDKFVYAPVVDDEKVAVVIKLKWHCVACKLTIDEMESGSR